MKEEEIRPRKIFKEYLRLCEIDSINYFSDEIGEDCNCPSCENNGEFIFEKSGFKYNLCNKCSTIFLSPRPKDLAFIKYYTESPSVKFWSETFYKKTAEARRKKIWEPKASKVLELIKRFKAENHSLIDIGAGYGIFCEEMKKISGLSITAIEPGPELAKICKDKGIDVIENFLEKISKQDLDNTSKVFTSFELFEHLQNPKKFLLALKNLMSKGDIFIFTTLSGAGVDIQALWENSNSVSPPHHLNFFNPLSIEYLLNKTGFKTLEITTPGSLDIDILINNQDLIKDRFWKTLIKHADRKSLQKWQSFISESGCSSHMMVCCQKR